MATVCARPVYSGEQFSVTAMELRELQVDRADGSYLVSGGLAPIAVIVREADRIYALDMAGRPVEVRRLRRS